MSTPTLDEVMEVARVHSIRVAVGWSGFSIHQIRRLRREEGFERGRGHPSLEEMEKEMIFICFIDKVDLLIDDINC